MKLGGCIQEGQVKDTLDVMGLKKPNHEVREILLNLKQANKLGSDGVLSKDLFKEVRFVWNIGITLFYNHRN